MKRLLTLLGRPSGVQSLHDRHAQIERDAQQLHADAGEVMESHLQMMQFHSAQASVAGRVKSVVSRMLPLGPQAQ